MKRIVTAFLLVFFAFAAQAQNTTSLQKSLSKAATVNNQSQTASGVVKTVPSPNNEDQPLATIYKTEAVRYFQDTTNGNWWTYSRPLNEAAGDSIEYFGVIPGVPWYYQENGDSIGPIGINLGTSDTTAFDTMYYRVMGLRVSPPTDLGAGAIHLDSAQITIFPEAFNSTDNLQFWVVPVEDLQFADGNLYPIPAIFGYVNSSGQPVPIIAKASIPGSKITPGQMNTLTVSFASKSLTTPDEKNQIGILVFVDGPNFTTDTVGYMLEADSATQLGASLQIDTDGYQFSQIPGPDSGFIAMRTYQFDLDGGNLALGTPPVAQNVGGPIGFFVDFSILDPMEQPTGNAFEGNLALTTYFHGTALAGVSSTAASGYSLDGNYPNPVSSTTDISYYLGQSDPVTLNVYNVLGQNVGTLVNSVQGLGQHNATFNIGTLPNGMYYYKLQSGEFNATNTMVIAR